MSAAANVVLRAGRRAKWEGYIARTTATRLMWDALGAGRARAILDGTTVYQETIPPLPGRPAQLKSDDARAVERDADVRVYHVRKPTVVEAEHGYPLARRGVLLREGLPRAEDACARATVKYFSAFPSIRALARCNDAAELPRAISLRHAYEYNFYHALLDLFLSLVLIERTLGVGDIPILVGQRLWATRFFQELRRRGWFGGLNWVEHSQDVRCRELIWAKPSIRDTSLLAELRRYLEVPSQSSPASGRIFLTRSSGEGRGLSNFESIRPVLARHRFEVRNPGQHSIAEQFAMFARAKTIIAVHGAALTHLALRPPGSLNVVELLGPARPSPLYWELAAVMEHPYRFIVGRGPSNDSSADFELDPSGLGETVATAVASRSW